MNTIWNEIKETIRKNRLEVGLFMLFVVFFIALAGPDIVREASSSHAEASSRSVYEKVQELSEESVGTETGTEEESAGTEAMTEMESQTEEETEESRPSGAVYERHLRRMKARYGKNFCIPMAIPADAGAEDVDVVGAGTDGEDVGAGSEGATEFTDAGGESDITEDGDISTEFSDTGSETADAENGDAAAEFADASGKGTDEESESGVDRNEDASENDTENGDTDSETADAESGDAATEFVDVSENDAGSGDAATEFVGARGREAESGDAATEYVDVRGKETDSETAVTEYVVDVNGKEVIVESVEGEIESEYALVEVEEVPAELHYVTLEDTRKLRGYELVTDEEPVRTLGTLRTMLENRIAGYDGNWSVYVKNLSTDESFVINDQPMLSASVMKLFILGTVYKAFESGELERTEENLALMNNMIIHSSNEDSNELLFRLGDGSYADGIEKVDEFIREYGYSDMTVEYNGFENAETVTGSGKYNQVAAKDCGKLLEDVYRRTWMNRSISNEIETMLLSQKTRYKIPAGLPEGVLCGNKSGEMDTTENDAAIIYADDCDYILVVLSNGWNSKDQAISRISDLSRMTYGYLADDRDSEQ